MSVTRNYFQKFPAISYNDYVIRDISVRTKLTQYLMETGLALLPYTVKDGERADSIASFYYEDPYFAWAIYLVNGIVDPYSEWPKSTITFNEYIDDAYGGIERAQDTIVRYEVNWAADTTLLTPEQYEALPVENKKYWEVQFGFNREPISYFRRELDWTLNNNRLDRIIVVSNSSVRSLANAFVIGERVYQYNFLNDVSAKATVAGIDATVNANTIVFSYSNSSVNDISFVSGNTYVTVKSTSKILATARVSGTNIPSGAYVKRVMSGTQFELSVSPTGNPASNSSYIIRNPAFAQLTLEKVDFSDAVFASSNTLGAPSAFFSYETTGEYLDKNNYVIGRLGGANVMVLRHERLDDPAKYSSNSGPFELLAPNSQLSINELPYWKSVNAYEDELNKNEQRKEIFVLDSSAINALDDNLEKLVKNV